MIRRYRGEDYWITERPSGQTVRHKLKNGQYLTMKFWRLRTKGNWERVCYCWKVSVFIGGKKAASKWHRKKLPTKQTGDCGLEGLRIASEYLLRFANNFCGWRDELQIDWEDDKRRRAYRWLLRHPGFIEYKKDDDYTCIAFRHPDLYEWIGKGEDHGNNIG